MRRAIWPTVPPLYSLSGHCCARPPIQKNFLRAFLAEKQSTMILTVYFLAADMVQGRSVGEYRLSRCIEEILYANLDPCFSV